MLGSGQPPCLAGACPGVSADCCRGAQQHLLTASARCPLGKHRAGRQAAAMDMPRILLVDDDLRLRELIGRYLEQQGLKVLAVGNGEAMRKVLAEQHVDLMVLDLMLPGADGLSLTQSLRAAGNRLPIIMLTARGDEVDRVVGLELGADDYLPKPCNPRELLARIRAVLRRMPELAVAAPDPAATAVCFGPFTFDPASRRLSRAGQPLKLTSGEFAVLRILVAHPHQPVSRDRLLALARGETSESFDRAIDVMVSRLRRLIEDDPKNPRWLQTVWGVGYVFVP